MNYETLKTKHNDLFTRILNEGKTEGATTERARWKKMEAADHSSGLSAGEAFYASEMSKIMNGLVEKAGPIVSESEAQSSSNTMSKQTSDEICDAYAKDMAQLINEQSGV